MPQLNVGLEIFANWQTVLLSLCVYVASFGIRRIVETGWVLAKKNKWWNEVLLPLTPVVIGVIFGIFAKSFPWPLPVSESLSARVMYGVACGVCCGWLYARIRGFVKAGQEEKAQARGDLPEIPPPPPGNVQ